jgi:pyruvate dehydrogenase E2 component (dihydrolipoamide acetyltransferase)
MTTFNLPDLGEGLPEAEIVAWHVAEGDSVKTDDLLVSVETAKAVVEVPSPYTGVIEKLYAGEGDIVATGAPLVEFSDAKAAAAQPPPKKAETDAATVVGTVPTGGELIEETAIAGGSRRQKKGRIKATPSVRTQAKRLGIDLADVVPTGKNGQITVADLESFAAKGKVEARAARPKAIAGRSDQLRGPRRVMAQSMSKFRDEVALCTLFDDADIHEWINKHNITSRILRAIVAGCVAEPSLNGFYNPDTMVHQKESRVDIAMAVDTEDGLIVPVIRNVEAMSLGDIRAAIADLKQATRKRTVAPQDMLDYTFTLSNFGMMAGRYATARRRRRNGRNRGTPDDSAIAQFRPSMRNRRRSSPVFGSCDPGLGNAGVNRYRVTPKSLR